ncbi:molecular chaperone HscC, partial [Bowmanella sp. Y57]|nr:molecular chaperone HscC [Bowmanella yangjiangensis]
TLLTGQSQSLVIENNPGVMTPEEIAERFSALQALKTHPRDQQVNSALMARLERLYQESLGDLREHVGVLAGHFSAVLERQDEREIREARAELLTRLDSIESGY